jgi:ABC-type nitrate/sulfonate/bicarbonate transport system permease component
MNGVKGVPSMYVSAARNFGLSSFEILRRVVFPAALPQVLTGLRIALGIAWLVVVAAEMIAVDSGPVTSSSTRATRANATISWWPACCSSASSASGWTSGPGGSRS